MEGTRAYRGVSAADRQAQRRARLIAAVLEILRTEGIEAPRPPRRYFYESFADLDALLAAVFDEVNQEIAEGIVGALAQAPPEPQARARAGLAAGLAVVTDDPGKGRL